MNKNHWPRFLALLAVIWLMFAASVRCHAQGNIPPQQVNSNYQFKSAGADSGGMRIPKYSVLPTSPQSNYVRDGAIAYRTTDSTFWYWKASSNSWRQLGSSQNLQQTVLNGNYKTISARDTSNASDTLGHNSWFWEPSNYNVSYSPYGKGKRFSQAWQVFNDVNLPITRPNMVGTFWGYNTLPGAGIDDTAENAGFGFRTETAYNLNSSGRMALEFHLPEVYYNHGLGTERLFSFYVDALSGATQHQSQVQSWNFNTKNTNQTYYSFDAATTNGDSSTSVSSNVTIADDAGSGNLYQANYSYRNANWAPFSWAYDRGGVRFTIDPANPNSFNGKRFEFTGNTIVKDAGTGNAFFQLQSLSDEPTSIIAFLSSTTSNNVPQFLFDRRINGSAVPGNGFNLGQLSWGGGDNNMQLLGRTNGTFDGGNKACFDAVFNGFDADGTNHDNLVVKRDGSAYLPRGPLTVGNTGADPSAAVDVTSTTKGLLPPRMTTIQKNAISSPAEGLMVYDLTLHQMSYFNGTLWVNF